MRTFEDLLPDKSGNVNIALGFETSSSNTRLNSQSLLTPHIEQKLDTLSGAFRNVPSINDARAIINEFERLYNDRVAFHENTSKSNGRKWDGHTTDSSRGLQFCWQRPVGSTPGQVYVYVSGQCLSSVDERDTKCLFRTLHELYGFDATRFDAAIDDYNKIVSFEQVKAAIAAGNVAGARKFTYMDSFDLDAEAHGLTIYMGSPKSDKMTRMYDKFVQSNGEIDAIRWETQFRRYKANVAFHGWLETDGENYISSLVMGAIDFVDRSSGDKNLDRLPRLHWWEEMIHFVGEGVKIPCKKVVASLQKSVKWIEHQVSQTLAIIQESHPEEFPLFLQCTIDDAVARFTSKQRARIQMAKEEQLVF